MKVFTDSDVKLLLAKIDELKQSKAKWKAKAKALSKKITVIEAMRDSESALCSEVYRINSDVLAAASVPSLDIDTDDSTRETFTSKRIAWLAGDRDRYRKLLVRIGTEARNGNPKLRDFILAMLESPS